MASQSSPASRSTSSVCWPSSGAGPGGAVVWPEKCAGAATMR